jgi:N-acetylglucosaminyldiphosphoundecaprenol N-acetyl-beta-D-mannosaminyltransferase
MAKRREILGVKINKIDRNEALNLIGAWLESGSFGCKQVVTAYSEFLVRASEEAEFKKVLNEADLVVPDGVSVLAGLDYKEKVAGLQLPSYKRILVGLETGKRLFEGKMGKTVTGVWLFEALVKLAAERGWRIFLLGGFGDKAEKLKNELQAVDGRLRIEADAGEVVVGESEEENERVLEKINNFKPDLLFVAYGPIKQEKWIKNNKSRLKVKVAIGVGGTFDEVLGDLPRAPNFFENHGLKWLWRLWLQPRRIKRIYKAVIVFPWKVFRAV